MKKRKRGVRGGDLDYGLDYYNEGDDDDEYKDED